MDKELDAFNKLREKLIKIDSGSSDSDTEFPLKVNPEISKKHHYIPKFFIDGFINDNNEVWCYDKVNDRIQKDPKGSKGVFFEIGRNNVNVNGTLYSIFEDAYKIPDDIFAIPIKLMRRDNVSEDLYLELVQYFNLFLSNLYCRSPHTDKFIDTLYSLLPTQDRPFNGIAPDSMAKQQLRLNTEPAIIEAMSKVAYQQSYYTIGYPQTSFCLGDMPFLLRSPLKQLNDLATLPLLAPISNQQLFVRNISKNQIWDGMTASIINALIIHQSSKFIICSDKKLLESSITQYHNIKQNNLLDHCMIRLFGDDLVKHSA